MGAIRRTMHVCMHCLRYGKKIVKNTGTKLSKQLTNQLTLSVQEYSEKLSAVHAIMSVVSASVRNETGLHSLIYAWRVRQCSILHSSSVYSLNSLLLHVLQRSVGTVVFDPFRDSLLQFADVRQMSIHHNRCNHCPYSWTWRTYVPSRHPAFPPRVCHTPSYLARCQLHLLVLNSGNGRAHKVLVHHPTSYPNLASLWWVSCSLASPILAQLRRWTRFWNSLELLRQRRSSRS